MRWAVLRDRRDALVGQARAAGRDGRRGDLGARRRARPDDRRGAARDRRPRCPSTCATASSPWSPRPGRPTWASSTTSPASPRSPASTAGGCTSTAPTAGPALAAPSVRQLFDGVEHADSFIVDPHKWLFAPFDACALLYRDPRSGPRGAHPARRLPRPGHRRRRVEPVRLRDPADPAGPRAAVLVLPRGARHRRLPRRGRADAGPSPGPGRELIERRRAPAAAGRARPVGAHLRADRLGRRDDYAAVERAAARPAGSPS